MTKKTLGIALLLLLLAACNTFKGMGEDIQATGRAIDKAAR